MHLPLDPCMRHPARTKPAKRSAIGNVAAVHDRRKLAATSRIVRHPNRIHNDAAHADSHRRSSTAATSTSPTNPTQRGWNYDIHRNSSPIPTNKPSHHITQSIYHHPNHFPSPFSISRVLVTPSAVVAWTTTRCGVTFCTEYSRPEASPGTVNFEYSSTRISCPPSCSTAVRS